MLAPMEPYRTAGFRCPVCTVPAPLREFQSRLICDECQGLLLDEPDYIASCADLTMGANLGIEVTNASPAATSEGTAIACPRCERQLSRCRVTLVPIKVKADVLRCDRDGIWFEHDQLTRVFARVGLEAYGYPKGPYYGAGDRVGLDGLPVSRHGPASGVLRISEWRSRPRKRAQTATPINLYRDQRLACPGCTSGELRFFGDRYQCEQCAGTFVQNAALESMVMDISKDAWDLPAPTGTAGTRACPVCTKPMIAEDLERVPIDRCAAHGVYFDMNELTVALENASHQFDPRGVRAWLKRLFTRGD
jgi:Zn-finger nucleic acid-binding protein